MILNLLKKFQLSRLPKSVVNELLTKFALMKAHGSRVEADLLNLKWYCIFIFLIADIHFSALYFYGLSVFSLKNNNPLI